MNAEFLKRMRKIQAEYEVKQKEIEKKRICCWKTRNYFSYAWNF